MYHRANVTENDVLHVATRSNDLMVNKTTPFLNSSVFPRPWGGEEIHRQSDHDQCCCAAANKSMFVCLLACLVCLWGVLLCPLMMLLLLPPLLPASTAPVHGKGERVHKPEGINPSLNLDCVFICPPLK